MAKAEDRELLPTATKTVAGLAIATGLFAVHPGWSLAWCGAMVWYCAWKYERVLATRRFYESIKAAAESPAGPEEVKVGKFVFRTGKSDEAERN